MADSEELARVLEKARADTKWRAEWFEDAAVPTGSLRPEPGAICPTCERVQPVTVQDHDCDDKCQEEEHRSIRCILQIVPEPGEECPLCREKTPSENTLRVRKWRAGKKRG